MNGKTPEHAYHICIVDDDQFLLDMYMVKFKEAGCDVQGFVEGRAFISYLKTASAPDAILLDVVMPGMSGLELLHELRAQSLVGDRTAVVILSNQSQDHEVDAARQEGVDGYLIKASTIPSEVLTNVLETIRKKQG